MTDQKISLKDLALVRQSLREIVVSLSRRLGCTLSNEEADMLYLEAFNLIQFSCNPATVLHIIPTILSLRQRQDDKRLEEFKQMIIQCSTCQEVENLLSSRYW